MAVAVKINDVESVCNADIYDLELVRSLNISREQIRSGEGIAIEEVEKRVMENLRNGYYARNRK